MKQHTFKWLSYSLLVLLLISCNKKDKGFFDDFPPGKFDIIWISDLNGIKDTILGEVSGPFPVGTSYSFRRRFIQGENQTGFSLNARSNGITIDNVSYYKYPDLINTKIVNSVINDNNLFLSLNSGDTLIGTINLIRK